MPVKLSLLPLEKNPNEILSERYNRRFVFLKNRIGLRKLQIASCKVLANKSICACIEAVRPVERARRITCLAGWTKRFNSSFIF